MNRNYSLLKMSPFNFYNILIHITYNPSLFMQCIQSILAQTYNNYKIYACYEDDRCVEFLKLYPQINSIKIHRENNESPNKCYNHLLNRVTDGWILFLNNNMMFSVSQTLYYINKYTISDQDILFWKVKLGSDELVPNIHDVKMGEIHSTGYCFHSKFKNKSNWNNGDYISGLLKDKFLIRRFIPRILVQSILKELPPINILIRNTYRPSAFSKCIESILIQTYTNYKIIMCYDDDRCLEYLTPYMTHSKIEIFKVNRESEERYFYNLYCNYLLDKVNTGWIIFLDDDKKFTRADTLDIIYQNIKTEEDIILWKVKLGQYIIFPNIHDIKFGEIDSTSFCFHSKFKDKSRWIAKQGSDFHYITNILNNTSLKRQFIPMILTQSVLENSFGQKGIKEEYKFKEFIDQFNIKQIYISNSLVHLKTRLLQRYKLQNYHNTREPSIFFGIYTNDDLNSIKHHNHSAYLMPGGSEVSNSQYFKEYQFLAISKDIKTRLIQFNIFPTFIQLNLVDRSLFKPVQNLGTKIFIYDGIRKKSDNAYIYGKPFYDKVIEKLPQYEYIFSSDLNAPYEKMPEIYAQCFIGLRLTPHDGNANMVQEMEAMNIPVVHNQSEYGLKWENVEDVVGHITSLMSLKLNQYDAKLPDITIIINSFQPELTDLYNSLYGCLNQIGVNSTVIVSTIENDPTIKFIQNLNIDTIKLVISKLSEHPGKGPKGIYYQLNKALLEVKTRFFSYFSSNDIMLPTKSYNEIKKILDKDAIFCFSKYVNIYPDKQVNFNYNMELMNYKNLLIGNYINDCATIDLSKLEKPLQFNYEKYGNVCYWDLWIHILNKYGEKSMVYNDNIEWKYIKEVNKSQAMQRANNIQKQELYYNIREFMLSNHNHVITPQSIYKYNLNNEKIWWWNDISNSKPIEMTVALPALNAKKIIWLALESLKNQINIDFAWELIVFEEEGVSKNIVQSYKELLPGCVRIIYKIITKEDAFYKIEDIKKNKCTSYYTLLEKWINIAKYADNNSKIFVKHAVDCYSPPKRLYIHYEHFKNDMCYYSTQPKGYFYNINDDKWMLYDGYKLEPVYWDKYGPSKIQFLDSKYTNDISIKVRGCHLNMALRTNIMRKIPLPIEPKRAGLDGYILYNISILTKIRPEETKIVFTDDDIDNNNWKYSLDTDGHNNISNRISSYYKINPTYPWKVPCNIEQVNNFVPDYIMDRLKKLNTTKIKISNF